MPGGHSDAVPPDPIPNSEVKRISGDGSVGSPHVRVAHRQAPNYTKKPTHTSGLFSFKQHLTMLLRGRPFPKGASSHAQSTCRYERRKQNCLLAYIRSPPECGFKPHVRVVSPTRQCVSCRGPGLLFKETAS